jgi:hypothetical protein
MNITPDPYDLFQILALQYPELMKKSAIGDRVIIPAGWHDLFTVFCRCLSSQLFIATCKYDAAILYPRDDGGEYLAYTSSLVEQALEELPSITCVFSGNGLLCISLDNNLYTQTNPYAIFANEMSRTICRTCGLPASIPFNAQDRTHVFCEQHQPRNDEDEDED